MKIFWVSLFILLAETDLKRSLQIERNQPTPSENSPGLTRYRETKTSPPHTHTHSTPPHLTLIRIVCLGLWLCDKELSVRIIERVGFSRGGVSPFVKALKKSSIRGRLWVTNLCYSRSGSQALCAVGLVLRSQKMRTRTHRPAWYNSLCQAPD